VSAKTTTAPAPAVAETLLDLPRLIVAIRRKRRMWLSLALLGLIAGGLVAVFLPPTPTAITRLLVVHENDQASDSGNLMQTDVAVLQTTRIAGDALKRIGSDDPPDEFLKTYKGTGLTSNVLEIEVTGTSTGEAVRRARALADAFIDDHVRRTQMAADADAKALIAQQDRTQVELNKVNGAITAAEAKVAAAGKDKNGDGVADGTANGGVSATETETLYARRAELTSKISELGNRADEAGIGAPRVTTGTQIVDAPRAVPFSLPVTSATNAAIGFGLALVAGITIAAVTGVVRDKPVLRRDIAAHLGASVIAQVSMPGRGITRFWRQSRAVRERKRVAGTLVRLVRSGAGPVSVLELGSRRLAAALALDVATELSTDRDVVIIEDPAGRVVADDLPGRDLHEITGRAVRPIRIVGADETGPGRPGETRIGIGSVTPGTAWTDLRHLGNETLLVVRTGFANTAWLHTVACQLADCRIPIVGVVLVDPDPRDKSDGTLWDSLYTALRGRGLPPAAIEARTVPAPADEEEDTNEDVTEEVATPQPIPAPVVARVPVHTEQPAPASAARPVTPAARPVPAAVGRPIAVSQPSPVHDWAEKAAQEPEKEPAQPDPVPGPEAEPGTRPEPVAQQASDEKAHDEQPEQAEPATSTSDERAEDAKAEPQPEPRPHPERKPSWVPEPVATTEARPSPRPHPERKPSWVPEPVAKSTPAVPAEQPAGAGGAGEAGKTRHDDRTPMPVHYPAPVPANGVNGRNGNADLPTKRFAPVQPHLNNGGADDVHDLPTKRFAPVQPDHRPKS
jgi:capsular polysaccharide biosynthesis protein